MGTDQPRYIKVDKHVILTAVEKLILPENDRSSLRSKVNLKEFISLLSVRLRYKAGDLDEISLSTDCFSCSVTIKFDNIISPLWPRDLPAIVLQFHALCPNGENIPVVLAQPLEVKKSKSMDVSQMRVVAVALTNCKYLGSPIQGANVIGVDPGVAAKRYFINNSQPNTS
ncbi:hypothetical protein MIR68_011150 [Amoeboaphelidium protococcarum]|nr:hypothetical protein MIR68_011150 [Amoeboaphelidium protococcarum]